jgi:hypothetical protein
VLNWNVKTCIFSIKDILINKNEPYNLNFRTGVKFLYINLNSPSEKMQILLSMWLNDKLVEIVSYEERKLVIFYMKLKKFTGMLPRHRREMNGFNVAILNDRFSQIILISNDMTKDRSSFLV